MTTFGKILVFMNLVFSVITGALIVFVFTTRAQWKVAYEAEKAKAASIEANYNAERKSRENESKQKEAINAAQSVEITTLKTSVEQANAQAAAAKGELTKLETRSQTDNTSQQKLQAELDQLKSERDSIVKQVDQMKTTIVGLQKEVDTERGRRIDTDLRARTLQQKNENLLKSYEELLLRNRELEQSSTLGSSAGGQPSILTPPPKPAPIGVTGKIEYVGGQNTSLAQINIGSDSGLAPGNELTIYRGDTYVGKLNLVETQAKASVGKFIPNGREQMKVDDRVTTGFGKSN
jgi:hypothetical protein